LELVRYIQNPLRANVVAVLLVNLLPIEDIQSATKHSVIVEAATWFVTVHIPILG
jgi:hypothetical protein